MMELSKKACRLCLLETDFSISLHSKYCRKTNMTDKILVCLKIIIEESDTTSMICYKCANNVEKYHDFLMFVKRAQARQVSNDFDCQRNFDSSINQVNRRVTSYVNVREEVFDADYTFSFLQVPEETKPKEPASSPFFSYFSPPKKQTNEPMWKAPRPTQEHNEEHKMAKKPRNQSRDFFESQSQEAEEPEPKALSWKLTPDDSIIKRLRSKCFGRSDF